MNTLSTRQHFVTVKTEGEGHIHCSQLPFWTLLDIAWHSGKERISRKPARLLEFIIGLCKLFLRFLPVSENGPIICAETLLVLQINIMCFFHKICMRNPKNFMGETNNCKVYGFCACIGCDLKVSRPIMCHFSDTGKNHKDYSQKISSAYY